MFIILLALVLLGWAVHLWRSPSRSRERAGELLLVWVLVGYCGIPMLAVAGVFLVHPHEVAHILGFEPDHPFGLFLAWAYLGMAIIATLSLRFRETYLVGPAVVWAVFFAGATLAHVSAEGGVAQMGHAGLLVIFAAHGLISVLLAGGLWASGIGRARSPRRT